MNDYESTLTRDANGYCKLFGIEFKMLNSRKWKRASLTMHHRAAIQDQAALLGEQEGWNAWRVVEVA